MNELNNTQLSNYQKFVVLILALLQFTIVLDFMIISPLGDILIKSLNISTKQFGVIVSSYAFSAAISGIIAAGFADKYDRKKLLLFFYTGFIIGTFFCGVANTYETILLARVFTGLFGGVIGSISMAIVTDLFLPQQRGRVISIIQMAFALSQIAGIPLGIFIANKMHWHISFLMIDALAILIFIAVVMKLKPITAHLSGREGQKYHPFKHLLNIVTNKRYQKGFIATMLLPIGGFMIMPFTTAFLVNNIKVSHEQLPMIFFFSGLASFIVMPLVGKISDKIDRFKIFVFGSLWAAVFALIYTHLHPVSLWFVIGVNILMFVGIMSRMIPASALNSMLPYMKDRGTFMSVTAALQQIAGGIGAVFAGLIVYQKNKISPIQNFDILGYIVIVVFIVCIYFVKQVSKEVTENGTSAQPIKEYGEV